METIHIEYNKTIFDSEIQGVLDKFQKIVELAEKDAIKQTELHRNVKAVQWLNKTFGENLKTYGCDNYPHEEA